MDDIRNPSAPPNKSRKYAQPEHERRFLLAGPPAGEIVATTVITDNYLLGTRLRLRRAVETAGGATTTVYKFTQKVPAPDGGPGLTTNLYLTLAEYETLAALPARQLCKTRHRIPPFVVDVFEPPLHGLTLAEAEFSSGEELQALVSPPFAVAEVTRDIRFSGGRLVTTTRAELLLALASFDIHLAE